MNERENRMKKRLFTIAGIVVVIVLIGFAVREIRYAHYPVTIPASEEWESYVNSLDAVRQTYLVKADDGVGIEAQVFIPNGGRERKPAVVWTGGSSDGAYHNYAWGLIETYVLDVFLERDMAVILTNKRGVGESEGNWTRVGIEGRAEDIYAVAKFFQEHLSIDAENIGLIGHSQGGWVVQQAAADHDDIAFFISLAGPTTSVARNIEDNTWHFATCDGTEGTEREKAIEDKLRLVQFGAKIGKATQFGMFYFDSLILDYDPAAALQKVQSPGLFVYAENDDQVTPQWSLDRLDELFDGNLPENFTTVVLEDSTHVFRLVDNPCESWVDVPSQPRSDELISVLNGWLETQGY
jgi:pimeloyl-ACP methyl ester carboxylesterase